VLDLKLLAALAAVAQNILSLVAVLPVVDIPLVEAEELIGRTVDEPENGAGGVVKVSPAVVEVDVEGVMLEGGVVDDVNRENVNGV
jgi:hypothetical protein